MIVSKILHLKCFPNALGVVLDIFANSQQIKSAVEYFNCGKLVLFELLPIIFIGINSLSEQLLKLIIYMTDSIIIKDQLNHKLMMTLALPTHSMSNVVLIDACEFYFTSALACHTTNQIPSK